MIYTRWAIVWKNLETGVDGIGEGLFVEKAEALEFARLVAAPEVRAAGANVIFDAEPVLVDSDKPLLGQVMDQIQKQRANRANVDGTS